MTRLLLAAHGDISGCVLIGAHINTMDEHVENRCLP
ncbi:uncharacterized protein METZ01_LOCUS87681 [marine metagenome]|uniref:Uncharacterized protein n=1 Tax=marine metagenome TaxID=408172 RepID=A0A381V574_9ZZZZ